MFATEQDYDNYVSSGYTEPHISYIVASGKIKYNINSHQYSGDTGEFRGTYDTAAELSHVFANNGDYAYVRTVDPNGNELYSKYIYTDFDWSFQYTISDTTFNASEWAAIRSGITQSQVNKLDLLPDSNELVAMLGDKQDELISGINIKTINNESILGEGNITVATSGGSEASIENTTLILQ